VYAAAAAPQLLSIISLLWMRIPWDTLHFIPERAAMAVKEHDVILQAIRTRQPDVAGRKMANHIDEGALASRKYLEHFGRSVRDKELVREFS
jgi:DNA-binding GntR family transcriptional regulator